MSRPNPFCTWPGRNSYWQLQRLESDKVLPGEKAELRKQLEQGGYKPRSSVLHRELAKIWLHYILGLLCYDRCTDAEVKTCAIDRGLASPGNKLPRSTLTKRLVKENLSPTFNHFTDLPSKIRTMIYQNYMSEFTTGSVADPDQPPISRVSRMLRSESLSLFYSIYLFSLTIDVEADGDAAMREHSQKFFRSIKKEHLSCMRNFRLLVLVRSSGWWYEHFTIKVAINAAGTIFEISLKKHSCHSRAAGQEHAMRYGLGAILKDITGREGRDKLRLEDLNKIASAMALLRTP